MTHPEIAATRFIVRFPGKIFARFKDYDLACQYLNYLRHEKGTRKSKFNPDDYRSTKPNSFIVLKDIYLDRKKNLKSHNKIEYYINRAAEEFGMTNIRDIRELDIDEYLYSIPDISEKTRYNHMTQLRNFWDWCLGKHAISLGEMPVFPEIDYELGYRKITDWETQEKVIDKVRELSYHINPKIWLGIDMLATYTALRPDDLRRIYENSLDANGYILRSRVIVTRQEG